MKNEIQNEIAKLNTRRWFLQRCGVGMAGLALNSLFLRDGFGAGSTNSLAPRAPHFTPRAKRVVYISWPALPAI